MYSVSINCLLYALFICFTVSNLYNNNYLFITHLYTNNCSVDLYNDLQKSTVLFTSNFTQGRLNSYWLVGCFILIIYSSTQTVQPTFSKYNVRVLSFTRTLLRLHFFFLCIVYTLLFVYCVHIASCCVRLHCVFVIYLFHINGLCFCSFCLLF